MYFQSPIIQGIDTVEFTNKPLAKRVVFIVSDGLRADMAFGQRVRDSSGQLHPNMPFSRNILKSRGSFGVSKTRMPTETRPGHVAMLAGFYEDISAVTKGWKVNPVDFDSFLNQAKLVWAVALDDIIPLFTHGNKKSSIRFEEYAELRNMGESGLFYDQWTLDNALKLFSKEFQSDQMSQEMQQEKIAFFFYFGGMDNCGHYYRPLTEHCFENLLLVDKALEEIDKTVNNYFNDNETVFVFSSDHGMSSQGSHGDGSIENINTPFLAWGKGIKKPLQSYLGHDDYSSEWGIDSFERRDINQNDICPLLSALIGVPIPVNSSGKIPLDVLDADDETKALMMITNAKQILKQYAKSEEMKKSQEVWFTPFPKLNYLSDDYNQIFSSLESKIKEGQYAQVIYECETLMRHCHEGLRYLHMYNWFILRLIIVLGYVGWMAYSLFVMSMRSSRVQIHSSSVYRTTGLIFMVCSFCMSFKKVPFQYYVYLIFPVYFWTFLISNVYYLRKEVKAFRVNSLKSMILYIISLEMIVLTFFDRRILIFGCLILAYQQCSKRNYSLSACLLVLSVFPVLDPQKQQNVPLLLISGSFGAILIFLGSRYSVFTRRRYFQCILTVCSMVNAYSTSTYHNNGLKIPLFNMVSAWLIFLTSLLGIIWPTQKIQTIAQKSFSFYSGFLPIFVLLSSSYEVIFYILYYLTTHLWPQSESGDRNSVRRESGSNLSSASAFLFLLNFAFFGVGNFASISSFSLDSIFRFFTGFRPFIMSLLLILKLIIPYVFLSISLGRFSREKGIDSFEFVLLIISTCDVMTLNFFFLVKEEGSWLDIGTSITNFIISGCIQLLTMVLFTFSEILIHGLGTTTGDMTTKPHGKALKPGYKPIE